MIGQTVAIYRNRRTGEYRIQPCARDAGIPQEFGPEIVLPADVSSSLLLDTILNNLPKTDTQTYERARAPKYSDSEHRAILKEQRLINVRQSGNDYKLVPYEKRQNSFGSISEMTKVVTGADFLKAGGDLVRQMFDEML